MKIVNFAVNNFRSISGGLNNNRIDFNGINTLFIFGQNNAGKSTFLRAYEYFYEETVPSADDFHKRNTSEDLEFEIEVELDEWDKKNIEEGAGNKKESYKEYLIDGNRLRFKTQWSQKKTAKKIEPNRFTFLPESNGFVQNAYASFGLHSTFKPLLPKPIWIKAMPNEEEVKITLNTILEGLAVKRLEDKDLAEYQAASEKIRELQGKMYKKESIDQYQDSVNGHIAELFPAVSLKFTESKNRVTFSENKLEAIS